MINNTITTNTSQNLGLILESFKSDFLKNILNTSDSKDILRNLRSVFDIDLANIEDIHFKRIPTINIMRPEYKNTNRIIYSVYPFELIAFINASGNITAPKGWSHPGNITSLRNSTYSTVVITDDVPTHLKVKKDREENRSLYSSDRNKRNKSKKLNTKLDRSDVYKPFETAKENREKIVAGIKAKRKLSAKAQAVSDKFGKYVSFMDNNIRRKDIISNINKYIQIHHTATEAEIEQAFEDYDVLYKLMDAKYDMKFNIKWNIRDISQYYIHILTAELPNSSTSDEDAYDLQNSFNNYVEKFVENYNPILKRIAQPELILPA